METLEKLRPAVEQFCDEASRPQDGYYLLNLGAEAFSPKRYCLKCAKAIREIMAGYDAELPGKELPDFPDWDVQLVEDVAIVKSTDGMEGEAEYCAQCGILFNDELTPAGVSLEVRNSGHLGDTIDGANAWNLLQMIDGISFVESDEFAKRPDGDDKRWKQSIYALVVKLVLSFLYSTFENDESNADEKHAVV